MGFLTGTTHLPDQSISEHQRRMLLGQAMDLNCLTWLIAIAMVEQQCMDGMSTTSYHYDALRTALQKPLLPGTDEDMVGGECRQHWHPWKDWGILNPHDMTNKVANDMNGGTKAASETLESCMGRIFFAKEDNTGDWREVEQRQLSMTGMEDRGDSKSIGIA